MNDKGSLGPKVEIKSPLEVVIHSVWEFWQANERLFYWTGLIWALGLTDEISQAGSVQHTHRDLIFSPRDMTFSIPSSEWKLHLVGLCQSSLIQGMVWESGLWSWQCQSSCQQLAGNDDHAPVLETVCSSWFFFNIGIINVIISSLQFCHLN